MTAPAALELRGLSKSFTLSSGFGPFARTETVHALREVDLVLPDRSILGLVGESGSGKTTAGMVALRLTEPTSGQILLGGTDITRLGPAEMRAHRRRMQVVFQDSYSALDPMFTLARIVAEPLVIHGVGSPRDRTARALDWLARVGLARDYGNRYPHELSGGQRQRVAIARALILEPQVLIADEPTSALDVSVKAQIINLLMDLQAELGLSILFISHDLSVVRSLCDRVAVMWGGRIVEEAPTEAIFTAPHHPYTRTLLDAIPATRPADRRTRTFLNRPEIEAQVPRHPSASLPARPPAGPDPILTEVAPGHLARVLVT
jgi:ABC-type oligopeptide transport system ATPase subunit